jgi:DNA polymerase-3 subunit epsilon
MDKLIFDIETTGADSSKDRIVQLAIKIINEQGEVTLNKSKMYNPKMPISKSATDIHGISNDDVKDCPTFKQDAKKLKKLFEDKIIITFNGMIFDLPILMSEFDRAGVEVNLSGKFFDVLKIERKLTPNNLSAVYKRYTGQSLEGAHNAQADVDATEVILRHQMNIIEGVDSSVDLESELVKLSGTEGLADYYGKLKYDAEGFLVFNFGQHRGKRVKDNTQYASWILDTNFPSQVKNMIRAEQSGKLLKPKVQETTKNAHGRSFGAPPNKPGNWKPVQLNTETIDDLPF